MNPLIGPEARSAATHTALSVNINKVALLRNTRALQIPSVTRAATIVLDAGASGITVHPRPDERHVRESDVDDLAALLRDWPRAEFNIEGNPFHNLMPLIRRVRPTQCTFVPDSVGQSTSDHGWDLAVDGARLQPLIAEARELGVRVSLFMDPVADAMRGAADVGADRVELYTESYARAHGGDSAQDVVAQFAASARVARDAGLAINAGHDLNRHNLADFLVAVPGVVEVSIGHALIADAIESGLAATVKAYLDCIACVAGARHGDGAPR